MIEIRYKRVLFFQAIFLVAIATISYSQFLKDPDPVKLAIIWVTGIVLNLFFLKKYALPTNSLLKRIGATSIGEDLSWAEIEENITKKDVAFDKQKEEFEMENLKYKLLLDSLEDPVCILNKELIIIYANQSFVNHFNFPEKELPVPLIEVSRNLDFQEFLENAVEVETTTRRSYFSFNSQDAHKSFFDLKVFPVDNINNYLCLLHNVTERKMADQMREDFVANFSHEVRTPLTILNGQMQNLKMSLQNDPAFDQKFAPCFQKIDNNSRRLINLFNDLLRLTAVETKREIMKEEIDIEEMLNFLSQDLTINYPEKKIQFDIELEQKIFWVDYNLFEQALINLIDNALKYGEPTGTITIRSYHEEGWDHLIISDNGVGIPEDQLHRIFERFFRVDSSRSSEIQGTGLGLSIVKHIVQKHEGRIKAQSREGNGTSFTLSFPSA